MGPLTSTSSNLLSLGAIYIPLVIATLSSSELSIKYTNNRDSRNNKVAQYNMKALGDDKKIERRSMTCRNLSLDWTDINTPNNPNQQSVELNT